MSSGVYFFFQNACYKSHGIGILHMHVQDIRIDTITGANPLEITYSPQWKRKYLCIIKSNIFQTFRRPHNQHPQLY